MDKFHAPKTGHLFLLVSFLIILLWSAIKPKQLNIWILEVLPAILGVLLLVLFYNRFRFTTLVYTGFWLAAVIMAIGGHYTYGSEPLFNWLKDTFHLGRNYYDRMAHFVEGGIGAIALREIFLRESTLRGKRLAGTVLIFCLALSASYELLEWGIAHLSGSSAEAFVGLQGDIWDTHWDMALALSGAVLALLAFRRLHDRYLTKEIRLYSPS